MISQISLYDTQQSTGEVEKHLKILIDTYYVFSHPLTYCEICFMTLRDTKHMLAFAVCSYESRIAPQSRPSKDITPENIIPTVIPTSITVKDNAVIFL